MRPLTRLPQNCAVNMPQTSPLARCYCQHLSDKCVAGCCWPSEPREQLYFLFSSDRLLSLPKGGIKTTCRRALNCLLVPIRTSCLWCGSFPQYVSESKQSAHQAARRGLMNRLCELPPDRRWHTQQHRNHKRSHWRTVMVCSSKYAEQLLNFSWCVTKHTVETLNQTKPKMKQD